jgi:hypothetical protein
MTTVAGCGGAHGRLSAPKYAHAASTTCVHANRVLARVKVPPLSTRRDAARAMSRTVAISRDAIDDLRGLRPPQQLTDTAQKWIALLDQGTDELELMGKHVRAGRFEEAVDYGAKATTLFDRAEQLVAPLHITSCGGPELPIV